MTSKERLQLSHGFDRGNYANAYETTDYETFLNNLPEDESFVKHHYRIGCLLGFFSSYEIHEVPYEYQEMVETARNNYKDFV